MATEKIEIRNGQFVLFDWGYDPNEGSVPIERLTDRLEAHEAEANGWTGYITRAGKLVCECEREYQDGIHSVRFVIEPNGFSSLTYTDPDGRKDVRKRGFIVPKGKRNKPLNGVLGLSGGNVTTRYAYFRDAEFQAFLDKFGITAVTRENPNKRYVAADIYSGGGRAASSMWSDGEISDHYEDAKWFLEALKEPGSNKNLYHGKTEYSVNGATWVVMESSMDYGNSHSYAKILYTEVRDVTTLADSLAAKGLGR